jgi:hypothetical protein
MEQMNSFEGPAKPRPSTSASAGARRAAMRVVQDHDTIILVYEFETGLMAETPTLVFERSGTRRELTKFPADWRRLSDAQLVQMLESARGD